MKDYIARVKAVLTSQDPKAITARALANEPLLRCKTFTGSTTSDLTLSNLSVAYKNESFIGTQLMPIVTVPGDSGHYKIFDKRDMLAVPASTIGPRGRANEIRQNVTDATFSCLGRALEGFIENHLLNDLANPLFDLVDIDSMVNESVDLDEELTLASTLTTAANYGGNTVALAGADMWDSAAGGDPVSVLQTATNNIWAGQGSSKLMAFCSVEVFSVLARHPRFQDIFRNVSKGLVTSEMIANQFGWDGLLIGRAWKDTANINQTATIGRIWNNTFGLVRVARNPSKHMAAWGFSFANGQKHTTQWFDPAVGVNGGYYCKVGHWRDYKVVAPTTGYLVTNVIA